MSNDSEDSNGNLESTTNGNEPKVEAATISDEQRDKLANLPQPGQAIDLSKLFKFEGGTKNIANALLIIVGGEETDKYAMFERTNFPINTRRTSSAMPPNTPNMAPEAIISIIRSRN